MTHPDKRLYRFGGFTLEVSERRLKRDGQEIYLPPKTFETLLCLVKRHGHLIMKKELLDTVWAEVFVTENTLTHRIKELRDALADDPQHPRYIKTIPRVGYKFIAEVEEGIPADWETVEETEEEYTTMRMVITDEDESSRTRPQRAYVVTSPVSQRLERPTRLEWSRRAYLLPGVAALVVLLAAGAISFFRGHDRAIASLAVLPFANLSVDPEQEYLTDGVADALVSDLARVGALRVIPRTSVMQYKGTRRALPEIARELNVDVVVEGSVARAGKKVRITLQLVGAARDEPLWVGSYERDLGDVLALQREMSHAIIQQIKVKLTPEDQSRLARSYTTNPAAYEAYLMGRFFWNKRTEEGRKKAIEYLEQASAIDPNYALAFVGLADCYNINDKAPPRHSVEKAREAANRALEIDGQLAEAYATRAFTRTFYDWDWAGAEQDFKHSIEINPNYSVAHHWYGLHLAMRARFDDALLELKRARELDPLSLIINAHLGWLYYFERRYDEAIEVCNKTLEMDQSFDSALVRRAWAYEQKGMYEEAIADLKRARDNTGNGPSELAHLAHAYAASGRRGEAVKTLTRVEESLKQRYVTPYFVATAYAALGERNRAFDWLEKTYQDRSGWLAQLKVDPRLDSLRSDPRFQDLLLRVGLS